ncbi:MAG: hypothetical protein K6U80_05305 [Firmicutes bacterium]|nr:hypothetical protein [Bacillota bacterium]
MPKKVEEFLDRFGDVIFFSIILILGTMIRFAMFSAPNGDLDCHFVPWYDFIVGNGRFAALRHDFAVYNVPYLYLLTLATYLPVAKYTAIKLISVAFDFLAAWAAYKIIGLKYNSQIFKYMAFLAVFLAPTVLVNSSYWGQCDIMYTAFVLWTLYFALKKDGIRSMLSFGLAFSFKLQALFLAPLVGILIIKKLVKLRHLIYVPVIFIILLLPAVALGRDPVSLLSIYIKQPVIEAASGILTSNCVNFYQLFSTNAYHEISNTGKLIALIASVGIVFYAFKIRKSLDAVAILKLGVFNALITVYFLPNMHERYFFMADVMSIILAFYAPRLYYMPVVIGFSSLFSYLVFLRGEPIVDFRILAIAMGVIIVMLAREIMKDYKMADSETGGLAVSS